MYIYIYVYIYVYKIMVDDVTEICCDIIFGNQQWEYVEMDFHHENWCKALRFNKLK